MANLKQKTIKWGIVWLLTYSAFFIFLDRSIDLWVHTNLAGTWVDSLGSFISFFATGPICFLVLIFLVLLTIIYDPKHEKNWARKILFVCVSVGTAIVIGETLKIILGRYRPVMLFKQNLYGLHFFSTKWAINSTPSGHTLRAFSCFTALSLIFPKKMPLFIFLAILIGISRIAVTAHYPSDVIFGCFIGVFSALWINKKFFNFGF